MLNFERWRLGRNRPSSFYMKIRSILSVKEFKMSHRKSILYHLHILDPELDNSISDDDFG
jgi:hypothetical protein